MQTPVFFLVFNRPQHTRRVLERLRQVRPSRLYIHADGPRETVAGEAEKVAETRAVLEEIDWPCQIERLFRYQNRGLRHGVFEALNWFFEREPGGIIIEDDCLADPSFFAMCEELLAKYAVNEQVMHIGGSNLAAGATQNFPGDYFFSRHALVWGWASWARAWRKMSIGLDGLEAFETGGGMAGFVPGSGMSQAYMLDKFRKTRAEKLRSWAYAWQYSILRNKGLCIVPRLNLVENTGIGDRHATNTTGQNPGAKRRAAALDFPLAHPAGFEPRPDLERAIFHAYQKDEQALWKWFLLKKIGLR